MRFMAPLNRNISFMSLSVFKFTGTMLPRVVNIADTILNA